ncbi:MAG: polyprenyl diphosphate synthase [Chlamydiales bacterium]|nr:polyprenyl diphosphate synthase [Chlamydiales bacterium]
MTHTSLQPKHFSLEDIKEIKKSDVPRHIAIIPDGNRRWATQSSQNPNSGHKEGSRAVVDLVESAAELGVKTLTLYTFSTENWLRPKEEVDFLMELLEANILEYGGPLTENGVKLETIGDLSALSPKLQKLLAGAKEKTKNGTLLTVVLAINYGARDEMCRAIRHMVADCKDGKLDESSINESTVSQYLDTAPFGDPDLFIRTSGEMRISNFLLWQLCYTELYIPKVLWPDFTPALLLEAVREFQHRKRRFGL